DANSSLHGAATIVHDVARRPGDATSIPHSAASILRDVARSSGPRQLIGGLGFSILYALIADWGGSFYAQIWGLLMFKTYAICYLNEQFHLVHCLRYFISTSRDDSNFFKLFSY
ncbi:unnamed protein product, partial [Rotaria socialis]